MFIVNLIKEELEKNPAVSEWTTSVEVEWDVASEMRLRPHWVILSLE